MSASGHGVEFTFDGETIRAEDGQTVTGALHAAGTHVLSRSFKYHRPRGLFCGAGRCPNCLCTVDGTPNVRICTVEATPGMTVKSQNRFPSLRFDVMGIFDWFSKMMPVGFYYKRFYKPRWMWPIWEKFIRRIAGLGEIDQAHGGDGHYDKLNLFCDVAVVGGGLAGLSAALEAAEAGASVILFDDQPALGGHLRYDATLTESDGGASVAWATGPAGALLGQEDDGVPSDLKAHAGKIEAGISNLKSESAQLASKIDEVRENVEIQASHGNHPLAHHNHPCGRHCALPAPYAKLVERVATHPNIQILSSTTLIGVYEENYLAALQGKRLIRTRALQTVVATGGWERPLVFARNDLPGVMLASAAQRLVHLDHGTLDGPVVVVTDNAQGYRATAQLADAGSTIAAVIDLRDAPPADETALLKPHNIAAQSGRTIIAASGGRHVTGATIAKRDGSDAKSIACRWIVQAVGFTPATSLLYQSNVTLKYDEALGHVVPVKLPVGTHAAGAVTGSHDPARVAWEGRRAGLAAAIAAQGSTENGSTRGAALGTPGAGAMDALLAQMPAGAVAARSSSTQGAQIRTLGASPSGAPAPACYLSPGGEKKKFVCLCEDVTEKDVYDAIDEGYSNIETLKRFSTISMGPCQGKMCQASAVALCAFHNKKSIEETGVPTSRPPEVPTPMGALAGRTPHFVLVRRTPMHAWHEEHGARFMDAGNWKRPERYTSPEDEYKAVRNAAGLIDVSTLGKIELRGRDVVPFLEHLYPNKFADLKEGRTRYGIVCDGSGIILDDGTVSRLGPDRYFLTTTTGNADAIESWFRWNLAGRPDWDVTLANVSGSYAAMNLAGPKSRDILKKLTTADVSQKGLPYLAVGQFDIAGIPAIVFRIGFVGELGYEIHIPAEYGPYLWEKIYEAGQPLGLKPFGVEAQRRLRLDKKHILVSIDTDALSNPLEAELAWAVKFDKPDFIGKLTLKRCQERGAQNRLVGFRMTDDSFPPEASLILNEGRLAGRVTSSRFSPAAGTHVGLAWVPVEMGRDGNRINITIDGLPHEAIVQDAPFYDPAGEKLRS